MVREAIDRNTSEVWKRVLFKVTGNGLVVAMEQYWKLLGFDEMLLIFW